MKKILNILVFIFFGLFGVVNEGWSDSYTITFSNNANSATAISSTVYASTAIANDGSRSYVTAQPFTINAGNCYYGGDGKNNIRVGKSGSSAGLSIALSASGQVSASTIVVNCMVMTGTKNTGGTLSVNGATAQTAPTSANNLTFTINDDIESITLTSSKAVFIYSITVNYSMAPTPSYTITAQSNNDNYGTVSLDGSVITGSPKTGYTYASPAYTVSPANSATVSQNGNEFTVTPSANTTVTINFEAIPQHTINWYVGSDLLHTQTACDGTPYTNPEPLSPSACDDIKDFVGWTTRGGYSSETEAPDDLFSFSTDSLISRNVNYYAVFANSGSGGNNWVLIEDMSTITEEGIYALVSTDNYAFNGTISSGHGQSTATAFNFVDGVATSAPSGTCELTLTKVTNGFTMHNATYGYLYATKAASGGLAWHDSESSYWSYASNNWVYNDKSAYLRIYNNTFRTYGSNTNESLKFAKKGGGYGNYSTSCVIIHPDAVILDTDTIRIHVGETHTLTAIIEPADAHNKNVTWKTLNSDIATIENGIVTGINEGLTNVVVITEDGEKTDTCVVIVLGEANIDVVEWNPDWLKIDIENFVAATAVLENQNTQADIKQDFANELFFSKYFEAGGTNKMLAIYNGTKDTLDLNNYTFKTANVIAAEVNLGNYGNYNNHYMLPNTEILFVHYDNTNSAKDCADDIDGYQDWVEVGTSGVLYSHMSFGGRTSIALYKNSSLIDIIGIHNNGEPQAIYKPCSYATISGLNDDVGFYTYNGDNIKTEEIEADYFLSTNRCMLVRKNTVKDGNNAVLKNIYLDGNSLCNDTIALQFKTLSEEWMGYQIGNGSNTQALTDSTCTGLSYAGHYNYSDYYIAYDTIYAEQPIPGRESDGYYKIEIPELDTLSCTNLKILVKDENGKELEDIVKIPIMIKTDAFTTDATYFDKKECDKCDVVVLANKKLTVSGIESVNRDIKLYGGATLSVPLSTSYTVNTLSLRRDNDTVPYLDLNGDLNITQDSGFYFDVFLDESVWRWMTLPDTFDITTIRLSNGKKPVYGEDYIFKYYDGQLRADNLSGGWQYVPENKIFGIGEGFLFAIDAPKNIKKEYRFKFHKKVIEREKTSKTVNNLKAYGNNTGIAPNHIGWNLIGNPFMNKFDADFADPTGKIRLDSLVKVLDGNGNWTGQWELSNSERGRVLRYAVIPSDDEEDADAGWYKSVALDGIDFEPFTSFFVQLGGDKDVNQGMIFNSDNRKNLIVAKHMFVNNEDEELFLRIKVDNRKTGWFISNKFTNKYEPGDDLESKYPIYQLIDGFKYLYSAIPDSTLIEGVTVHSPGGHLILDPKVDISKFEYVYAKVGETWYNLLLEETDVPSGNFIIYAKRKTNEDIPTGIDVVQPTNGTYKFIKDNVIYINKNNKVYTIIGNKIR